jgi:hypothetical protein
VVTLQAAHGILQVEGGGGSNTLVGNSSDAQTWNITRHNEGTLCGPAFCIPVHSDPISTIPPGHHRPTHDPGTGAGPDDTVTFKNIGNLIGDGTSDVFNIYDGGAIDGSVIGNGSNATIDYSGYSDTVIVDLPTGAATAIGGGEPGSVGQITGVVGGSGGPASGPGAKYNVLVGNGGNTLTGGSNRRNLLIAGASSSTLQGGGSDDILIGGTTDLDGNIGALQLIMDAWTDDSSYANRASEVYDGGGLGSAAGLNERTVHSNGGGNQMTGHDSTCEEMNVYYGRGPGSSDISDRDPSEEYIVIS